MHRIACLVLTLNLCIAHFSNAQPVSVIAGYVPDYRLDSLSPAQVKGVTHLIYFSLKPAAHGRLASDVIPEQSLNKLKALSKDCGCKLVLCIGGWQRSDGFAELCRDTERLKQYVVSLANYCRQHGFTGVDYDWEHPQDDQQVAWYANLIIETKRQFKSHALEVSIAQAGWQSLSADAYAALDRVHLMAYDHDFPQATFDKALADVDNLIAATCPPEKIALGVPFYGRNQQGESKTYAELVDSGADGTSDQHAGYAFNSSSTLRRKLELIRRRKLAGVMIWELGQDTPKSNFSLLRSVTQ